MYNAPYTYGRRTSQENAEIMDETGKTESIIHELSKILHRAGYDGMTMSEATQALKPKFPNCVRNNTSSALGNMCRNGDAFRTTAGRKSEDTGRNQIVYVHKNFITPETTLKPKQKRNDQILLSALETLARVHLEKDHNIDFKIMMGAMPDMGNGVSYHDYETAWLTVWNHLKSKGL